MAPPRPRLALLVLVLAVSLGALSCEGVARRLHGSVACLDCAAGHDLSGVIVAVKCASDNNDTGTLHAVETDARGKFHVAMPASPSGWSQCAARILGATQRLCAQPGLTVARVVVPERAPPGSSYALGSRLAFFTRCGPDVGTAAATTTMAARDEEQPAAPRVPSTRPWAPVRSPLPAGGSGRSPYGIGGLPLIFFFPFVPIIGIP
ncbi:hypothetical protein QOZ80_2BG0188350 [Eleusine coracana subsp. coracana]|nr:hypothetical protein QOZ80_2BG0188350 [Eleusine coracana subsp. coracana]